MERFRSSAARISGVLRCCSREAACVRYSRGPATRPPQLASSSQCVFFLVTPIDAHPGLTGLEPGGWLQWGEPDIASMRLLKSNPLNSTSHLQKLWDTTASINQNLVPRWPQRFEQLFTEEGLTGVRVDRVHTAPNIEYAMHECNLLMYEMIARKSAVTTDSEAEGFARLVQLAAGESKHGVMFAFPRVTVIGRKPAGTDNKSSFSVQLRYSQGMH